MISPWLDPSRKPPNALRGLRRKMAHFIPNAGVDTKGSYNSTTTRLCGTLRKKRKWVVWSFAAEPGGSRFSGVRATAALELLRLAATIGGTALRRNPPRSFASKVLQSRKFQCSGPDSGSCKVHSVEIRSDLASPLRNAFNEAWVASGRSCRFHDQGI